MLSAEQRASGRLLSLVPKATWQLCYTVREAGWKESRARETSSRPHSPRAGHLPFCSGWRCAIGVARFGKPWRGPADGLLAASGHVFAPRNEAECLRLLSGAKWEDFSAFGSALVQGLITGVAMCAIGISIRHRGPSRYPSGPPASLASTQSRFSALISGKAHVESTKRFSPSSSRSLPIN